VRIALFDLPTRAPSTDRRRVGARLRRLWVRWAPVAKRSAIAARASATVFHAGYRMGTWHALTEITMRRPVECSSWLPVAGERPPRGVSSDLTAGHDAAGFGRLFEAMRHVLQRLRRWLRPECPGATALLASVDPTSAGTMAGRARLAEVIADGERGLHEWMIEPLLLRPWPSNSPAVRIFPCGRRRLPARPRARATALDRLFQLRLRRRIERAEIPQRTTPRAPRR